MNFKNERSSVFRRRRQDTSCHLIMRSYCHLLQRCETKTRNRGFSHLYHSYQNTSSKFDGRAGERCEMTLICILSLFKFDLFILFILVLWYLIFTKLLDCAKSEYANWEINEKIFHSRSITLEVYFLIYQNIFVSFLYLSSPDCYDHFGSFIMNPNKNALFTDAIQ